MSRKFFMACAMLAGIVLLMQGAPAQTQNTQQAAPEKKPPAPSQQAAAPQRIAVGDLKKKLESGEKLLLIDVREDWELKADGAIAGAIHIPVADLDARMKDIPKDVQLIFY